MSKVLTAQREHARTLLEVAQQFPPALNRMPSLEAAHKAQRAAGVLIRALAELVEGLRPTTSIRR